jgi:hypothetical protein
VNSLIEKINTLISQNKKIEITYKSGGYTDGYPLKIDNHKLHFNYVKEIPYVYNNETKIASVEEELIINIEDIEDLNILE